MFQSAALHYPHLVFSTNLITYSFLVAVKAKRGIQGKRTKASQGCSLFRNMCVFGYSSLVAKLEETGLN